MMNLGEIFKMNSIELATSNINYKIIKDTAVLPYKTNIDFGYSIYLP